VGLETGDDAGVYRLSDELAIIQTVDFFTPIVDDPYTFGQIAAANALSDVYAMGGKPLTAMNVVCFPAKTMDIGLLNKILMGGLDKLQEAGTTLVGGHSIDDSELKYGLSVTGIIHPDKVLTNGGAKIGDALILTINSASVPCFPEAREYAQMGLVPGGTSRNKDFFQKDVEIVPEVSPYLVDIFFDPQTSGGLLISVPKDRAEILMNEIGQGAGEKAAIIGEVVAEPRGKIVVK